MCSWECVTRTLQRYRVHSLRWELCTVPIVSRFSRLLPSSNRYLCGILTGFGAFSSPLIASTFIARGIPVRLLQYVPGVNKSNSKCSIIYSILPHWVCAFPPLASSISPLYTAMPGTTGSRTRTFSWLSRRQCRGLRRPPLRRHSRVWRSGLSPSFCSFMLGECWSVARKIFSDFIGSAEESM